MMEFYAPKDLKEHKNFGVSNGILYSTPPKVYEKEWNEWKWEKREIEVGDIPLDAVYKGYCNPFNLPLDQGDTNYLGNVSYVYCIREGVKYFGWKSYSEEECVESEDRHGQIWHARSLFTLWEAARSPVSVRSTESSNSI